MKFENKGKWTQEAEDKLAAYDTQEHPDFLDKDDKVLTFEDDEIHDFEEDELDVVEEDDTLDSPEEEEDALMLDESSQVNEDNASELKKELNDLYRGIGWAEWDYFKEGLAYSTNFKPDGMSDSDLEKMINASGIAKVKQVKDIKMSAEMQDFMKSDFNPTDKIIVTRKPMSSRFYGESSQKNEATETTPDVNLAKQLIASLDKGAKNNEIKDFTDFVDTFSIMYYNRKRKFLSNDDAEKLCKQFKTVKFADESSQKNEASLKDDDIQFNSKII